MTKKEQHWYSIEWRNLSSFFLTLSGILILVSGIVLYVAPPGRYAHAVDWRLIWLDKGQWESLHTQFSYVAVIFTVIHLVVNWKILLNYSWDRIQNAYRLKRELTISILLTLFICVGTVLAWPPFSTIMDWGEVFSNAWESNSATVIFEQDPLLMIEADTEETHEASIGTQGGWGRYTVAEICTEYDITTEQALDHLAVYHIDANEETRIRTLADSSGYEPSAIVDIILGTR